MSSMTIESQRDAAPVLLKYSADINVKDKSGITPLYFALPRDVDGEIVKLHLEYDAAVNARIACGCTPLHSAIYRPRPGRLLGFLFLWRLVLVLKSWDRQSG